MLARGNQIQSKPPSVVRCARGNGELIPATTVYKPLLLSCFIGLQFIYSWITLFFVFCFFLLVGFHVHEILDFRVETARSRKSVLRFYILQTVSFVSIFFFPDSSTLWLHTCTKPTRWQYWKCELCPGYILSSRTKSSSFHSPLKQWQQHQSFKYKRTLFSGIWL